MSARILLRSSTASSTSTARLLTRNLRTSSAFAAGDVGPNRTHHLDKNDDALDPQTKASAASKTERATGGTQSQATSRKDDRANNARAKEEYPEAPGPVLGMNDEKGKKGH